MIEDEQDPYIDWIAQELRRPVQLSTGARARVMAAVLAEPKPRTHSAGWRSLFAHKRLSLTPAAGLAAAAGLVGIGVAVGFFGSSRDGQSLTEPPKVAVAHSQLPVHDTVRVVKFVFVAPQAREVALVGDFNRWDADATPMTRNSGNDVWSVTVPLPAGRHVYSFVVDGSQWLADPGAPLAPGRDFGTASSVVLVGGSSS